MNQRVQSITQDRGGQRRPTVNSASLATLFRNIEERSGSTLRIANASRVQMESAQPTTRGTGVGHGYSSLHTLDQVERCSCTIRWYRERLPFVSGEEAEFLRSEMDRLSALQTVLRARFAAEVHRGL